MTGVKDVQGEEMYASVRQACMVECMTPREPYRWLTWTRRQRPRGRCRPVQGKRVHQFRDHPRQGHGRGRRLRDMVVRLR